jgi:hypothetical protein
MSGIAPKQNAFKFKISPHKQKSIVKTILAGRWDPPGQRGPLANEALWLSTPKHNGKSGGTAYIILVVCTIKWFSGQSSAANAKATQSKATLLLGLSHRNKHSTSRWPFWIHISNDYGSFPFYAVVFFPWSSTRQESHAEIQVAFYIWISCQIQVAFYIWISCQIQVELGFDEDAMYYFP